MRISISHPSAAPFVQQAVRSFLDAGHLEYFYTSLAFTSGELENNALLDLTEALGLNLKSKLKNRILNSISNHHINRMMLPECARLLSGKLDRSGIWTDRIWEWGEHRFDKQIAKKLHPGIDAFYGYEHVCEYTFERARALGIRTIYDVPAPETSRIRKLLENEMSTYPEMESAWFKKTKEREPLRLARRKHEWELADIVICASEFTKSTFAAAGYDTKKVKVIPYGAPEPIDRETAISGGSKDAKVSLLWAGTFSLRKGAHYLLKSWNDSNLGKYANLKVFGSCNLPQSLLASLPDGIKLMGPVPHNQLLEQYEQSDALIFPTLYDGFGMVVTEALSRGCPVITTPKAGASQFIIHNKNGFIIKEADPNAITEIISLCFDHKPKLRDMREASLTIAKSWQWSDYRKKLREVTTGNNNEFV